MDQGLRDLLANYCNEWSSAVETILGPGARASKIVFNNHFLIPETGAGGFADDGNVLVLAFDVSFQDRNQQIKNLKASFFHESYHIAQGWLGDTILPAIDEAILEGAATVFERVRAGSTPPWGSYDSWETMTKLVPVVTELDTHYDQGKWKYFDEETGQKWVLYRLGTFIVDEMLRNNTGVTIEAAVKMTADDILTKAGLN